MSKVSKWGQDVGGDQVRQTLFRIVFEIWANLLFQFLAKFGQSKVIPKFENGAFG
jgi:hypothetical protein